MSNTSSRILRADQLGSVKSVWWESVGEETQEIPAPAKKPEPVASEPEVSSLVDRAALDRAAEEAFQKGFSEGKDVGRQQGMGEVQPVLDRLIRSLAEISVLRGRIRKDAEVDLVKLSIAVARRILHRELTLDTESISSIIRVSLEKLDSRDACRVRVHPDQEPAVRAALQRFSNGQNIEVVSDAGLQAGDLLFETLQGTLDASIEVQLREIERGFADRLKR